MHQVAKLNNTTWKDSGKANNFQTISTEMSVHRKGEHKCRGKKLQYKTIHVNKDGLTERRGTV